MYLSRRASPRLQPTATNCRPERSRTIGEADRFRGVKAPWRSPTVDQYRLTYRG